MNRKNFIRISGLSLAGLMTGLYSTGGRQDQGQLVAIPDELWAQTGGEWLRLTRVGTKYTNRDIELRLTPTDSSMAVFIQSPTLSLNAVKCIWKYSPAASAQLLGDHWERTYGDVSWQSPVLNRKMPWYFLQSDGGSTNCFGVRTGSRSICHWVLGDQTLQLVMDARCGGNGVRLGSRELHAADIIVFKGQPGESSFETGKKFCKLLCAAPRLASMPVYGINDWYFAYGNNSYDLIMQHTRLMADLVTDTNNRPFSVIDAGWAQASPLLPNDCCWQNDASIPNDKFRDMHRLAADIRSAGMRPGLWVRPLCAKYNDPQSLLLPVIPGRNDPKNPLLDPTIPENMEKIRKNISLFRDWGYELVKHDYTTYDLMGKWGFEMKDDFTTPGWTYYNKRKTTAEIMLDLYSALRESAGPVYLIGCNTMSHLSAGIFELNRIGDDTSGQQWDRTRKMGVNTLAFRSIHNNHFYAADADCVGITTDIPWAKNKQWLQLVAESGTPLFISGQAAAIGAEQKKQIAAGFAAAAKKAATAEPLDWLTHQWPETWKLNGQTVKFDWS